jgi:coenzyme F420-reducing hydrogenase gamma subunit
VGVPVVLDLVVRPPGQPRRDLGPSGHAPRKTRIQNPSTTRATCMFERGAACMGEHTCCRAPCGDQ